MKAVLTNLGFVLQTAGAFLIIPIISAFYLNEIFSLTGLLITALLFFLTGFLFNIFSEKKEIDFKSASVLLVSTFFSLGLLGSIPYIWLGIFNNNDPIEAFTNSYFESISGYTTTGLSLIKDLDSLPRSIIVYRTITEWIGGLSLIFILLVFFYRRAELLELGKVLGFPRYLKEIKQSYLIIILIFSIYISIFTILLYIAGLKDIISSLSYVVSAVVTGGFSPTSDSIYFESFPYNIILSIAMIVGGTSFAIHYMLIIGRMKIFTHEFLTYLIFIFIITFSFLFLQNVEINEAFFHSVSAATTTGFSYIDVSSLNSSTKMLLILIMFIGGCSFSTAGGIKIIRFLIFLKSIPWSIKRIFGYYGSLEIEKEELRDRDVITHLLIIIISAFAILLSAFFLSVHGISFSNALFEATSAFSTVGLSAGVTDISLASSAKWILIFIMILGRVEILPFLIAFTPKTRY